MLTHDERETYRDMVNDDEGIEEPKQTVNALLDEVDRLRKCVHDIVDFRRSKEHDEATSMLRRIQESVDKHAATYDDLFTACELAADAIERHVGDLLDKKCQIIESPLGKLYAAMEKGKEGGG